MDTSRATYFSAVKTPSLLPLHFDNLVTSCDGMNEQTRLKCGSFTRKQFRQLYSSYGVQVESEYALEIIAVVPMWSIHGRIQPSFSSVRRRSGFKCIPSSSVSYGILGSKKTLLYIPELSGFFSCSAVSNIRSIVLHPASAEMVQGCVSFLHALRTSLVWYTASPSWLCNSRFCPRCWCW